MANENDVEPEGAALLHECVEHANKVFRHTANVPLRRHLASGKLAEEEIYPALKAFVQCNESYNALRRLASPATASKWLKNYAGQGRRITVKAHRSLWEAQGIWLDRAEEHPNEALIKDWPGSHDFRPDLTTGEGIDGDAEDNDEADECTDD